MKMQLPVWILDDKELLRESVMYIDTKEYNADREFIKENISVRFKTEAHHKDWKYCLIFASYRKKDYNKFITAMKNHYNSLLIKGNTDLKDFMTKIEEKFKTSGETLVDRRMYYSDED